MKEYIYETITHPKDLFREMSKLTQIMSGSDKEDFEKNIFRRELFDLGNDNWAIYSDIRNFQSIKLTMKTHYQRDWMRLVFVKFFDNDVVLDADISMANHESFLCGNKAGFETYKTETWIQKNGDIRILMVFLNQDFFNRELWSIDLDTIKNNDFRLRVSKIQSEIMNIIYHLGIDKFDIDKNRPLNLEESEKKQIVLKLITETLWTIFPNQNVQLSEKFRLEIIGIREAEKHLMSDFSSEPHSLDDLAKIAGVNRVKFQKLFKEIYGNSFYTYYQKGRFNYARQLIEEKNYNLCEAGAAIGFKNLTHFSRQFERFMGIKPISLKSKIYSFSLA